MVPTDREPSFEPLCDFSIRGLGVARRPGQHGFIFECLFPELPYPLNMHRIFVPAQDYKKIGPFTRHLRDQSLSFPSVSKKLKDELWQNFIEDHTRELIIKVR